MTELEKIEAIRTIALFDGWEINILERMTPMEMIEKYNADGVLQSYQYKTYEDQIVNELLNLKYYSSWELLMPVVAKINAIDVSSKHFISAYGPELSDIKNLIHDSVANTDIGTAFELVAKFIGIYESQLVQK